MAFFKFRKGGDAQSSAPAATESVEALRKRARHRLIGASILVVVGVIGFPLVFDSQPRPIAVDLPIEIPDKDKVKPLGNLPVVAPAAQASGVAESPVALAIASSPSPSPSASPSTTASSTASTPSLFDAKPSTVAGAGAAAAAAVAAVSVAEVASKVDKPAESKPAADSKSKDAEVRYVVQIGAFTENAKAHEARMKLEHAGIKTYAQAVDTKDGKRIRVRVGPFTTKAEANKVVAKVKKLKLPAAILTL